MGSLSRLGRLRIRLLFRGVELRDDMPIAQLGEAELDLHFLVLGQSEEVWMRCSDDLINQVCQVCLNLGHSTAAKAWTT